MEQTETEGTVATDRNRLFAAISVVLGVLLALGIAEWGLGMYFQRIQSQSMEPGFMRYHPQFGWSLSPGWTGQHSHYDYQATYHLGLDGFRLQPSVENSTSGDFADVAVLGDSFTFGLGVEDDETFTSVLNRQGTAAFKNYGVPGTSTDQHLLLLNQIARSDPPDAALLIIYLPNDILDNTLEYPLQAEQAKPLFTVNGGRLELGNVPVPRAAKPAMLRSTTMGSIVLNGIDIEQGPLSGTQIGRMIETVVGSRAYDPAELRPVLARNLEPALDLFSALLREMASVANGSQTRLTIALLPGRDAMVNDAGISHHYQDYLRQEILGLADRLDVDAIDLMTDIAAQPVGDIQSLFFPNDGHLTPQGHRFVAESIARHFNP